MLLPDAAVPAATLDPVTVEVALSALIHIRHNAEQWAESDPENPALAARLDVVRNAIADLKRYRGEVQR